MSKIYLDYNVITGHNYYSDENEILPPRNRKEKRSLKRKNRLSKKR